MLRSVSTLVLCFFLFQICAMTFPAPAVAGERMQRSAVDEVVEEDPPRSYVQCYADGHDRAKAEYGAGGWFAGGLASGFLLGLIGTGIIGIASRGDVPVPPDQYTGLPQDCLNGYVDGYNDMAKSKKTRSAVLGGVIGTVAIVAVFLATQDN